MDEKDLIVQFSQRKNLQYVSVILIGRPGIEPLFSSRGIIYKGSSAQCVLCHKRQYLVIVLVLCRTKETLSL